MTVTIDGVQIAPGFPSYIIAEIGLNHNKDLNLVRQMIRSAKESGANAVKFQTYTTSKLLPEESPAYPIFRDLELTAEDFRMIAEIAKETGITFFSTPFSYESVELLESLNVPAYKIASMDLNYYELIHEIARLGKPVILSTGMGQIGEIEKAIQVIRKTGNDQIVILHCLSKYPPKSSEMNLPMISRLQTLFPEIPVGLSDHTMDSTMAVVSRTLGACVFEKHFTLNRSLPGPDQGISNEPADILHLRHSLTQVDEALKFDPYDRKDSSIATHARRSLFAGCDLKKGDILTRENIAIIRPGTGVAPEYLPIFLGRPLICDLKKGDKIDLSVI
jgi:N-acetylneuraminate synthase/N,N'-diacetyllegionaminate synthase